MFFGTAMPVLNLGSSLSFSFSSFSATMTAYIGNTGDEALPGQAWGRGEARLALQLHEAMFMFRWGRGGHSDCKV